MQFWLRNSCAMRRTLFNLFIYLFIYSFIYLLICIVGINLFGWPGQGEPPIPPWVRSNLIPAHLFTIRGRRKIAIYLEDYFFKIPLGTKVEYAPEEGICAGVFFSIKLPLHHIETPVQVLYCDFCEILKRTNFINVYEDYFWRVRSLLESLFLKTQVFTINRTDNCSTMKELGDMFSWKFVTF